MSTDTLKPLNLTVQSSSFYQTHTDCFHQDTRSRPIQRQALLLGDPYIVITLHPVFLVCSFTWNNSCGETILCVEGASVYGGEAGKSGGLGRRFLFISLCVCVRVCVPSLLCLTLCRPMDCRLLCPWNFPGKNTGVGCHFLIQRIFPTQGLNLYLLCLLLFFWEELILYHRATFPSGHYCLSVQSLFQA